MVLFLISVVVYSLLEYSITINFYVLILPNSLISFRTIFLDLWLLSMFTSNSSIKNSFISLFPTCITFVSLSCLISVTIPSSNTLKKSDKSRHSCFVCSLRRKALVFHHCLWCYLWVFCRCFLSSWENVPLLQTS